MKNSKIMKGRLVILVAVVIGVFLTYNFFIAPSARGSSEQLDNDLICMVNDAYMGTKQIPITVDDKIYYGCCDMCKDKLTNGETFRYAKDPYSGEKVDKATAFIVRKYKDSDEVSYFASEENYNSFKSAE